MKTDQGESSYINRNRRREIVVVICKSVGANSNSLSSLFQWVLGECDYDMRDWDEWHRQGWVVEDIESDHSTWSTFCPRKESQVDPNLTGSKGAEIVNQGTDDIPSSLAYHHQLEAVKDGHWAVLTRMNQKIIQWVRSSIFRFTPSGLARHIEDLCSSGGNHRNRIHDRSDTPCSTYSGSQEKQL